MALMLYERYGKKEYLNLVYRYASFLLYAQNEKGKFRNFMRYDRKWLEEEGSEDCFGRCLWALGFALSNKHTPKGVNHALSYILRKAMPNVVTLKYLRSKAYSVIGLAHLEGEDVKDLISETAQSLCRHYDEHKDGEWKWFEDDVTYCNFVLPWSLTEAYRIIGEKKFLDIAEESLEFLGRVTFRNGYFKPVGCKGWLVKGEHPAEYDEQTVEACEGVLTYLSAYDVTGKRDYLEKAEKCHKWYEGFNSKGISLIDSETGGCHDSLGQNGLNLNLGAESLVSYVISYLSISKLTDKKLRDVV